MGERAGRLLMLNPLAPILEGLRLAIIEGRALHRPSGLWHPGWLLYVAAWSVGGLLLAVRFFRRSAARFAEFA